MDNKARWFKDILWTLTLLGLVGAVFRLWYGLGATTNLTDAVPWGFWKVLNMIAGVALSTSGFTIGFLAYVLMIKQFKPLVKPAILIAFLGYGCSCLALLLDIGLPHKFWHPIFMWNEHSFLFEVFWCVLLYFTITTLELSPTILNRTPFKNIGSKLHKMSFGIVVIGISLSSLHHSSLGSLFLVTPQRLHPIWYSSLLPLFFIITAMGAGIMVLILLRIVYAYFYNPEPVFGEMDQKASNLICTLNGKVLPSKNRPPQGKEIPRLRNLALIATGILCLYLILRIVDFTIAGKWNTIFAGTWESWLFGFETLLLVIIPALLMLSSNSRNSATGLGFAALSASLGLALNRLDVGIFGYFQDAGTVYFPSLIEWSVGLGVVAAAGLMFFFIAENFPIFDEQWQQQKVQTGVFKASFDKITHVWNTVLRDSLQRVSLILVFVIPIAWIMLYPPYVKSHSSATKIHPPLAEDILRNVLKIDGNRDGLFTVFPHKEHQERLGGEESCRTCHHISMPEDKSSPCSRCHRDMVSQTLIFNHTYHLSAVVKEEKIGGLRPENYSCVVCHKKGQPRTAENAKACFECHEEDMHIVKDSVSLDVDLTRANSFMEAMHFNCIECHRKENNIANKPDLGECYTCHKSLKPNELALELRNIE